MVQIVQSAAVGSRVRSSRLPGTTAIVAGTPSFLPKPLLRSLCADVLSWGSLIQGSKHKHARWFWSCGNRGTCNHFQWADGGPNMASLARPPPGRINGPGVQAAASPPRYGGGTPQRASAVASPAAVMTPPQPERAFGGVAWPPGGRPSQDDVYFASISPPSAAARRSNQSTPQSGGRVKFNRISAERFSLRFDYDRDVIEDLKRQFRAGDRAWDPDAKQWVFRSHAYEAVKAWAVTHFHEAELALLPEDRQQQQQQQGVGAAAGGSQLQLPPPELLPKQIVKAKIAQAIPSATWNKLYPFQQEGVVFAVSHGGRALIADDMGLGKTVQAICTAACFAADWPLLVVCQSSMLLTWLEALQTWLPPHTRPTPANLIVIGSSKDVDKKLDLDVLPPTRRIVVTTYDLAQKLRGYEGHFGALIADESHALKNPTSKRTQFFMDLLVRRRACRRALFLTGTPAMSRPIELYTQIEMLRPGLMGTTDEFGARYCGEKVLLARNVWDWRGSANEAELNHVLREHLLVRRLKSEVLQQLPALRRSRLSVSLSADCVREVEGVKEEMAALDAHRGGMSEEAHTAASKQLLMQLYRVTGPAKLEAVRQHVASLLEQGRKLLVFAHHTGVLDGLEAGLRGLPGLPDGSGQLVPPAYIRIDGSTRAVDRAAAVRRFQERDGCRAALLSIQAAGAGITLSRANAVVFAELSWSPADLTQAEARAHRMGQESTVDVHYMCAPGSADDIIWRIVNKKLQVVGETLDGHLAGTATGLRITDMAPFAAWRSTEQLAGERLIAEPEADDGFTASPPDGARGSPVQIATPESRRGSGVRRARSPGSGAFAGPSGSGTGGRGGNRRRRLDFDAAADNSQADGVFSLEDDDDGFDAALGTMDVDALGASGSQRPAGRPPRPDQAPEQQYTVGAGVLAGDDDEELEELLSQEPDQAPASQQPTQAYSAWPDEGMATHGLGQQAGQQQQQQQQPPYSPYGRPPQQQAHASAWDYPREAVAAPSAAPQEAAAAEVVDLSQEGAGGSGRRVSGRERRPSKKTRGAHMEPVIELD